LSTNTNKSFMKAIIFLPIFTSYMGSGIAETISPLDPSQHPISPEYQPVFRNEMVPLDAKISWTERFNGDDTFSTKQVLLQENTMTAPTLEQSSKEELSVKPDKIMDARGQVKKIKASQGKIKIKHGPIDKYGMPAMTMVFKVLDPSLLTNIEKGSKIDFEIDNSSGGFVITNIVLVDE